MSVQSTRSIIRCTAPLVRLASQPWSRSVAPSTWPTLQQRHLCQPHTYRPNGFAVPSGRRCLHSSNVSDEEIATLARQHQHPLSLADLVRYTLSPCRERLNEGTSRLTQISSQTWPSSPISRLPPLLRQLRPFSPPRPSRPPHPSPPQPPLHRRREPKHLPHLQQLPTLPLHPPPLLARHPPGPTHHDVRGRGKVHTRPCRARRHSHRHDPYPCKGLPRE